MSFLVGQSRKWAGTFPRRGQLGASLKCNQRCVAQKNINALSIHVHKSLFQGISPLRSAFSLPFVCVGGRERDQTILVTMVIRALLAWLDFQECGEERGEGGMIGL